MPACGQTVGYGVCDKLELWRGAAGLCARVRACAGAAASLNTTYMPHARPARRDTGGDIAVSYSTKLPQAWRREGRYRRVHHG